MKNNDKLCLYITYNFQQSVCSKDCSNSFITLIHKNSILQINGYFNHDNFIMVINFLKYKVQFIKMYKFIKYVTHTHTTCFT